MKTDHYRLTKDEKQGIAQNLIDILEKNENITKDTYRFIANWVMSDGSEKTKAFYDVWEIVLKNYLPISRPVLFRSCERISKSNKIVSFTGRLERARRFSNGKGTLIICDTNESLKLENKIFDPGNYKNTFYPLHEAIKRIVDSKKSKYSKSNLDKYLEENEYIMRQNLERMESFRWSK